MNYSHPNFQTGFGRLLSIPNGSLRRAMVTVNRPPGPLLPNQRSAGFTRLTRPQIHAPLEQRVLYMRSNQSMSTNSNIMVNNAVAAAAGAFPNLASNGTPDQVCPSKNSSNSSYDKNEGETESSPSRLMMSFPTMQRHSGFDRQNIVHSNSKPQQQQQQQQQHQQQQQQLRQQQITVTRSQVFHNSASRMIRQSHNPVSSSPQNYGGRPVPNQQTHRPSALLQSDWTASGSQIEWHTPPTSSRRADTVLQTNTTPDHYDTSHVQHTQSVDTYNYSPVTMSENTVTSSSIGSSGIPPYFKHAEGSASHGYNVRGTISTPNTVSQKHVLDRTLAESDVHHMNVSTSPQQRNTSINGTWQTQSEPTCRSNQVEDKNKNERTWASENVRRLFERVKLEKSRENSPTQTSSSDVDQFINVNKLPLLNDKTWNEDNVFFFGVSHSPFIRKAKNTANDDLNQDNSFYTQESTPEIRVTTSTEGPAISDRGSTNRTNLEANPTLPRHRSGCSWMNMLPDTADGAETTTTSTDTHNSNRVSKTHEPSSLQDSGQPQHLPEQSSPLSQDSMSQDVGPNTVSVPPSQVMTFNLHHRKSSLDDLEVWFPVEVETPLTCSMPPNRKKGPCKALDWPVFLKKMWVDVKDRWQNPLTASHYSKNDKSSSNLMPLCHQSLPAHDYDLPPLDGEDYDPAEDPTRVERTLLYNYEAYHEDSSSSGVRSGQLPAPIQNKNGHSEHGLSHIKLDIAQVFVPAM